MSKFLKLHVSGNLKDKSSYCKTHGITYITTMDILMIAYEKEIFTKEVCNTFIKDVKAKGSKLPCNSLEEYEIILLQK